MKPNLSRFEDLTSEENFTYQRRSWLVQRIAFWVFGLILVTALLGLFGRGGFSRQQKTSSDGFLTLEYERFLHLESPESLMLQVRHPGSDDNLRIWINTSYLDSVQIEQVTPEPESVRAEESRLVYQFSASKSNTSVRIKLNLQPEKPGSLSGLIGLENGSSLSFQQFVYP